MTEYLFVYRFRESVFVGEPLACGGVGDAEVLGQACYIVIGHGNSRMGTAVARTFITVESHGLIEALVNIKGCLPKRADWCAIRR